MGYVEFQRNYLACVRAHKQALMAQRAFWNSLLRDTISFTDLQVHCLGGFVCMWDMRRKTEMSRIPELAACHCAPLQNTLRLFVLQAKVKLMDAAEQRATAVYRRQVMCLCYELCMGPDDCLTNDQTGSTA